MSHLSNPQAQRTLRFITGVACVGVGLQSIFFSKYEEVEGFEGKEHIFTNVQKDARDFIDRNIYGIDPSMIREASKKQKDKSSINSS
mmetsp:Transcript_3089/g.6442  ORF Transcript_3089/g.6442 Transcript_3089/m.6442 type:complete len:87 (+) Transcript_3089:185-445(+)